MNKQDRHATLHSKQQQQRSRMTNNDLPTTEGNNKATLSHYIGTVCWFTKIGLEQNNYGIK